MDHLHPHLFKVLTRYQITIVLLDGRTQTMVFDKTTKLRSIFQDTCALCNLDNDNLFGFATLMDDYYAFLNLDTKVCRINFKQIIRKSQNNILFKYPVNIKENEKKRRLSHVRKSTESYCDLLRSTSSTKSAPVYNKAITSPPDKDDSPIIYFMIKSYVFPYCLRDKVTKSLYFLQLLRNVLNYKLKCADEIYFQLGSLAIQAFYGDYESILSSGDEDQYTSKYFDRGSFYRSPTLARLSGFFSEEFKFTLEEIKSGRYFNPKKFFPSWIVDKYTAEYLYKEVPQLHISLHGMSRLESEFSYIRMASQPHSNFNMHLFPVCSQKLSSFRLSFGSFPPIAGNNKRSTMKLSNNRLWLGLSPAGLEIHQMKTSEYIEHLSIIKWSDISEVIHRSSCIGIHFGCRSLKLHTNSKLESDHLFWLTKDMHMYQRAARFSATCTEESLECAERQKYHEKYVSMDLEDLKLNGQSFRNVINSSETFSPTDSVFLPSVLRLPFVNTPAVPPRRVVSRKTSTEYNDVTKVTKSVSDACSTDSLVSGKQSQYMKKMGVTSKSCTLNLHKATKFPEELNALTNDSPYLSHFCAEDFQNTNSDLSSRIILDSPDCTDQKVHRGEVSSAPIDTFWEENRESYFTEDRKTPSTISSLHHSSIDSESSSPKPILSTCGIGKSSSFGMHEMRDCPVEITLPQRRQSDSIISYDQWSHSVPLLNGLCKEFNNTEVMEKIKLANNSRKTKEDTMTDSVGMKSWKSQVLFNLDRCLDNENVEVSEGSPSDVDDASNHSSFRFRVPNSFGDVISLSSDSNSLSVCESVDISSMSSFEMNEFNCSRLRVGPSAQVSLT